VLEATTCRSGNSSKNCRNDPVAVGIISVQLLERSLLATSEGRRRATQLITTNFEHIPAELLAHLMVGAAASPAGPALIDHALRERWSLDAERITCPVRVMWLKGGHAYRNAP
jgi:hypothetical protein